jgi:murein DD-endopeptidase MepM/ murein hydrolase activator NlpD
MVEGFRRRRWLALAGLGASMLAVSVYGSAPIPVSAAPVVSAEAAVRSTPRWEWPLRPPVMERGFEAPETVYSAGHRGIDLGAPSGAAVVAPGPATVRFAGMVVDRPVVTLDHGGGVLSSYEPLLSELAVGVSVTAGQHLGVTALGGHCDGSCLHIGVRVDGRYVSPLLYFDRVPRAILLPVFRDRPQARGWASR